MPFRNPKSSGDIEGLRVLRGPCPLQAVKGQVTQSCCPVPVPGGAKGPSYLGYLKSGSDQTLLQIAWMRMCLASRLHNYALPIPGSFSSGYRCRFFLLARVGGSLCVQVCFSCCETVPRRPGPAFPCSWAVLRVPLPVVALLWPVPSFTWAGNSGTLRIVGKQFLMNLRAPFKNNFVLSLSTWNSPSCHWTFLSCGPEGPLASWHNPPRRRTHHFTCSTCCRPRVLTPVLEGRLELDRLGPLLK